MVPSVVNGSDMVARVFDADKFPRGAACGFANPKSISFAPDLVSMMLPGLRSRWTTPLRWACSSPWHTSAPTRNTCSSGSLPLSRRSPSVSPSRYSITR
jgi:hypothetical protein